MWQKPLDVWVVLLFVYFEALITICNFSILFFLWHNPHYVIILIFLEGFHSYHQTQVPVPIASGRPLCCWPWYNAWLFPRCCAPGSQPAGQDPFSSRSNSAQTGDADLSLIHILTPQAFPRMRRSRTSQSCVRQPPAWSGLLIRKPSRWAPSRIRLLPSSCPCRGLWAKESAAQAALCLK